MRMDVKFIATAAVSASLGAAVGWAITADRAKKKSRQLSADYEALQKAHREKTRENIALKDELDDVQGENQALHAAIDEETGFADIENSPGETSPENVSTSDDEEPHVEPLDRDERDDEGDGPDPTDEELDEQRSKLLDQIREYVPSAMDERVFQEEQGGPVIASTKYDPPFVISQPDFAYGDEGMEYKKVTLKYYPSDQVLLDEDEDVIDDVDRYVGWRSLNQFGGESGDPNIVYVRNRNSEIDYEVEMTDEPLPTHVKYGMPQIEFKSKRAAGLLRMPGDLED